jgi:hypothetical protein
MMREPQRKPEYEIRKIRSREMKQEQEVRERCHKE